MTASFLFFMLPFLALALSLWGIDQGIFSQFNSNLDFDGTFGAGYFVWPKSRHHLQQLLFSQGIDLKLWGKGKAKTLDQLWHELKTGDSKLQVYPLRRQVQVACVLIRKEGQILIELEQEMDELRSRRRHLPPSEKIKQNETPREAAARCLKEELGLTNDSFTIHEQEPIIGFDERESKSYPGLLSSYKFFLFSADIPHLPDTTFTTLDHHDDPEGIARRILWGWGETPELIHHFLLDHERQSSSSCVPPPEES